MNFSALRTILVTFGPVAGEFTLLRITPLRRYGKNRHIMSNISEYPGPILTYFTGLVGVLMGMIIPMLIWRSPKGRCHVNQLNLKHVRRWCKERPLLVTQAFDNGLADREAALKRLNGNNLATLRTNLVNFRPIISEHIKYVCMYEFTLLRRAILPRFSYNLTTIFIRHLGVSKRIGRSQFWFQDSNRQSFLYILQTFGEIRFSNPGV